MENGVPMSDAAATRTAAERAAFVVVLAVCLNARRVFCPTNAELVVVVVVVARDAIIVILLLVCVSVVLVLKVLVLKYFCRSVCVACNKSVVYYRGKKRVKNVVFRSLQKHTKND